MSLRPKLAAIIFEDGEPIDALFARLRNMVAEKGFRVGGLLQEPCGELVFVTHIDSGKRIDLMQNLGACAEGCRLDTAALAEAAGLLAQSLDAAPDLLLVSRFGRVEAEGGGFLNEIGAASLAEIPTLIAVSAKWAAGWRAFSGDCAETLPCAFEAALAWWEAAAPRRRFAPLS